jgi:type II secretory pathway pseudopilin PulG
MNAAKTRRTRHIRRPAARLREEHAFAVPTVLLMMLAAMAVVSVGVVAASNTQQGVVRDQNSKAAVQLAEAGMNEVFLRYNHLDPAPGNLCSPLGVSPVNGWCQVGPIQDASGGNYSYQVYVGTGTTLPEDDQGNLELKVVGTGAMGNATRRVMTSAKSFGTNVFGQYQVKAGEDITLDSNASIHAGTAAGGDISLNANAKQCGNASVGVGHNMNRGPNTDYTSDPDCQDAITDYGHGEVSLPPINPGDVPVINDNGRFFSQDPVSGNKATACWNGRNANGSNGACGARHLDVGTNSYVTLTGSKYVFCKLTTSSNSALLVSGGADHKVVIYFDSPENCGQPSGTAQLDMNANSRISSNDGTPVELLFVGSPTRQTLLHLSSNTDIDAACEQNVIIYAPLSDIDMNSNSTYCGALAGRSIHLDSNAELRVKGDYDLNLQPQVPYYQPDEFVECRAAPATAPNFDAGC